MELSEFIEEASGEKLTPTQKELLIVIGDGHTPSGRSILMRDRMIGLGYNVNYRKIGELDQKLTPTVILIDDFAEMELRLTMAITTGYSHPEMFQLEPPADKRKGPKGPRKRWGNL